MTTTFETAKVGDRVWSIKEGWGEIIEIDYDSDYSLSVKYDISGTDTFTFGGYEFIADPMRTLFWDEVVIEAPQKPLPDLKVDAKVLVWDSKRELARTAHFCCFEDGKIYTYRSGRTSFTKVSRDHLDGWNYWELAE